MSKQPHPELNFRMGRGRIRERREAFSRESLDATCRFLGLSDEAREKFLKKTDEIRKREVPDAPES